MALSLSLYSNISKIEINKKISYNNFYNFIDISIEYRWKKFAIILKFIVLHNKEGNFFT